MEITAKLEIKQIIAKKDNWGSFVCKPLDNLDIFPLGYVLMAGIVPDLKLLKRGVKVEVKGDLGKYKDEDQIKIESLEILNLDSSFSLTDFLVKYAKGIGKKTALGITAKVGNGINDTLKIIEDPTILNKTNLSENKKQVIIATLNQNFANNELMRDLLPLGISRDNILWIQTKIDYIKPVAFNIYNLPIHYKDCPLTIKELDILVKKYRDLDKIGLQHLTAYIIDYVKREYYSKRNIYCNKDEIVNTINKYIRDNSFIEKEYTKAEILKALEETESLVIDKDKVFFYPVYFIQKELIENIKDRLGNPTKVSGDLEEYLRGSGLGEDQREAIKVAYKEPISLITGRAGTGKTTLLKTLCEFLRSKGKSFALCSYTGKAASTISSKTGFKANTIHKQFSIIPNSDSEFNKPSFVDVDYLIVDEAGLLGLYLTWIVFKNSSSKTRIILTGDDKQLLPINPGFVFHNLLKIKEIPKYNLTKIYRQDEGSGIIENANYVLDEKPLVESEDFSIIETKDIEKDLERLIKGKNIMNTQVITAVNKTDYKNSTKNLNNKLQGMLTTKDIFKSTKFNKRDKIINTKNNYELNIYNGDMGIMADIVNVGGAQAYFCLIDNNLIQIEEKEHREAIELGYAITVHKAQGSEWNEVIVVADKEQGLMINKNWFYTSITRGVKKVTILTDNREALEKNIKRNQSDKDIRDDFVERFIGQQEEIKNSESDINDYLDYLGFFNEE